MARWTLDDIPWDRFRPDAVEPDLLAVVKAAALVERNADDYARYLGQVFHDDPAFGAAAVAWAREEAQHGEALRRWAELADPAFDFAAALARFRAGYSLPLEARASVRGSRSGELIARCIVETGTSSYYAALGQSAREPVLSEICLRIRGDELRHYKLFYDHLKRYRAIERPGLLARARVAFGRLREADDDELAYAYYAANEPPERRYVRVECARAYAARAFARYQRRHVRDAAAMVLKAIGLTPRRWLVAVASYAAWHLMRAHAGRAIA